MTLAPYEPARSWLTLLPAAAELAGQIAGTDFVPTQMRNNPAMVAAAVLYGDEMGLGPMQSLARISVINGRPTLAAETQRALILRAGHDIWVEESTASKCTVAGRRKDSEATSRISWTLDDARRANLAGKPPWKMYPRQMLLARASAELARAVFPDAIGGLAATEELEDNPDPSTGNGPVATPAPKTTRRKRANVTTPATTPEAPAPSQPELPPLPGEEETGPESDPGESGPNTETSDLSEKQRRRLHALFREKNINERNERISYCIAVIGREITSSNELSNEERSTLITHLEQYDKDDPQTWPFPDGF